VRKKTQKSQQPHPKDENYRDEYGWPLVGTRAHHERMREMVEVIKKHPFFSRRQK
jgi:hypothetical protein